MGKKVLMFVLAPLAAIMVLALIIQLADPHLHIWLSFWNGLGMMLKPFGQFVVDIWHLVVGGSNKPLY